MHDDATKGPDPRIERISARWAEAPYGAVAFDEQIRVLWANPVLEHLLGVTLDAWRGREPFAFVHPDDAGRVLDSFGGLEAHGGLRGPALYRLVRPDGGIRRVQVTGINMLADPDFQCMVIEIFDLDEQQRAEALTTDEYEILEGLVQGQPVAKTLADIARLVERHGDDGDCVITEIHDGRLSVVAAPNLAPALTGILNGAEVVKGNLTQGEAIHRASETVSPDLLDDPWWLPHSEAIGQLPYKSCWSVPIMSSTDRGRVIGTVDLFRYDVGEPEPKEWKLYVLAARLAGMAIERSRFLDTLRHQATHDSLTGLLNRRAFVDQIDSERSEHGAEAPVAVFFVDLDRFKVVNDTHGHEFGDRLLCTISERLRGFDAPEVTVARIGGDEFVVAVTVIRSPTHALEWAEQLRSAITPPVVIDQTTLLPTASIGAALGDLARDSGDQLVRDADAALYRAKSTGRNRCVYFDEELRAKHRLRRQLEYELAQAMVRQEFEVRYQPIVELATGAVVGVEALARWRHPTRGLLMPSVFIPVAEDSGAIVDIDRSIQARAIRDVAAWNDERALDGLPPLHLWVNVSAVHLARPDTVDTLVLTSRRFRQVPLGIELTESAILNDRLGAVAALGALREQGIKVAIDDFGTGYSSLNAIRTFPVTHVKVDRSFVSGVLEHPADLAIVVSTVRLASALDLTITAEGIEATPQLSVLRELGCHHAQGFLFSEPVTAAELTAALGPGLRTTYAMPSSARTD